LRRVESAVESVRSELSECSHAGPRNEPCQSRTQRVGALVCRLPYSPLASTNRSPRAVRTGHAVRKALPASTWMRRAGARLDVTVRNRDDTRHPLSSITARNDQSS
jgi:hypothetical protein